MALVPNLGTHGNHLGELSLTKSHLFKNFKALRGTWVAQ